jgi:hypothetical protein
VCLAVLNALQSYQDERYSALQLNFEFIVEPLREVLFDTESVTYILLQLQVLAIRFKKQYRTSHVDWTRRFDSRTEFLQQVCQMEPAHVAMVLCRKDLSLFRQLTKQALKHSDNDVIRQLSDRWNYLNSSVEECMATTAAVKNKIRHIAKVSALLNTYVALS